MSIYTELSYDPQDDDSHNKEDHDVENWDHDDNVTDYQIDENGITDEVNGVVPDTVNFEEGGRGGGVQVSTEALKSFANYLADVKTELQNNGLSKIREIDIKPGSFYDAFNLRTRLGIEGDSGGGSGGGSGGVKVATEKFIVDAINALDAVSDDLLKLASQYDTAEELNAATGKDLGEHMKDATRYINDATGGSSASPTPDDDGGGDEGDEGDDAT
ncbi:hypothetical protein CFN78_23215 [Amycolatopsis antarctica]|uniref:Uncharacterized protein n=1 Tax=Amycolatopsis antarctica TaxID=1854586 RepID=A0A263CXG6_9PSEU|nr:hypothetical protein [Amycolatopsis antarctica]OZM70832.1 hypothetical protein CFN78_23215 [Amycolatopsis antarctica]